MQHMSMILAEQWVIKIKTQLKTTTYNWTLKSMNNQLRNLIAMAVCSTALLFLISGCDLQTQSNFQSISKDADGRISIIDQAKGRLIIINKSNRIQDVISLSLNSDEIRKIKREKDVQDSSTKIREWPSVDINKTKYTVSLSTRYYKDRLLYKIKFYPADEMSSIRARTISINLRDVNGFVLEKITPQDEWVTVVDSIAAPIEESANGEIPMTLDNYLEIYSFDPNWRFKI